MPSFIYTPLDTSAPEIRLLTLHPSSFDQPIKCKLNHVRVENEPAYEALSYVWGDSALVGEIELNGGTLAVTANLEIALRHLRLPNKERVLWIDAISINQSDLTERSEQVKRMRKIYSSATYVLAWTGQEENDSNTAVDLIEELHSLPNFTVLDMASISTIEKLKATGFDASARNYEPMFRFFERQYWTRIWVTQELIAAGPIYGSPNDKCIIGCGNRWFSREVMSKACVFVAMINNSVPHFKPTSDGELSYEEPHASFIESLQRLQQSGERIFELPATSMFVTQIYCLPGAFTDSKCRLFELMKQTTLFGATDPRDKVFALLGVCSDVGPDFPVDYHMPPTEVYRCAARYHIEKHGDLLCLRGNKRCTYDYGPSWCVERRMLETVRSWGNENQRFFQAYGPHRQAMALFDETSSILRVKGVLVGGLSQVCGPFDSIHFTVFLADSAKSIIPTLDSTSNQLDEALMIFRQAIFDIFDPSDPTRLEQLWRTLVLDVDSADVLNYKSPAPVEFEKMFRVLFLGESMPDKYLPDQPEHIRKARFCQRLSASMVYALVNRVFFVTQIGTIGVGPLQSQAHDVVVVLPGLDLCLVLRPKGKYYQIVGDAFVYGIMHGEAMHLDEAGDIVDLQEFAIC